MSFQLFVFSHNNNSVTNTSDTFISQLLERNLAVITIQIDTIICQRITMSRKGMIGTTGIITSTFASILSQEYTTGIYHFLRQFIIIASGDNQMFRRISIAEFNGLIIILH